MSKLVRLLLSAIFYYVHCILAVHDVYLQEAKRLLETLHLPIEELAYSSCNKRCRIGSRGFYAHCSCDVHCFVYRTCCEDIAVECPEVVRESRDRFGHMLDLRVECSEMAGALAVASCPNHSNYTGYIIKKDSFFDIINNVPVTDVTTGLIYANEEIFNCNVGLSNGSNSGRKWQILINLKRVFYDDVVSRIEHFAFEKPYYYDAWETSYHTCAASSVSLCNNSLMLQQLCHSFVPFLLLQNIVYNYTLCRACSVNLTQFSLNNPSGVFLFLPVTIVSQKRSIVSEQWPWSEAECDMSENATISGAVCRLVKCRKQFGFYLHRDGSCRVYNLFFIGFPNDQWLLNKEENEDPFNYMMLYVSRVLKVTPLGAVKPIFLLHNPELQRNFSIATFILDYNSSAEEDLVYYRFQTELSDLADDLRTMKNKKTHHNQRMELMHDILKRQLAEDIKTSVTELDLSFQWCSFPQLKFSLLTSSQNGSLVCISRLFYYRFSNDSNCLYPMECELKCYDVLTQSFSKSKSTSSRSKTCSGNVLVQLAHFIVICLFDLLKFRCRP